MMDERFIIQRATVEGRGRPHPPATHEREGGSTMTISDFFSGELVRTLHDGRRRRLDIAFSFITRPEMLLIDEPTKDLAPTARGGFHEGIRDLATGEGVTIILTTRDLAEAQRIGDRVAVLMQGRLVTQCDPVEAWRRYPGTP